MVLYYCSTHIYLLCNIKAIYFYYYIYNINFTVCTQIVGAADNREKSADYKIHTYD